MTRADRNTFPLTFGATVLFDLVAAVLLGLLMAAAMSLRHMASYSVVARQYLPTNTVEGDIDFKPEQEQPADKAPSSGWRARAVLAATPSTSSTS